ncbi:MAG: Hsp33 family molecular chaperone HslO [Erysipelotrichaceae bacterium]
METVKVEQQPNNFVKALACNGRVRILGVDATEIADTAQKKHDLWPTASAALGRTLAVGSIMGAMLKDKHEKLTIQINGNGPIGTIMVDAYAGGNVRGFVGEPHTHYQYNDTNKLAVGIAVGNQGMLKVIKDMGMKENFVGQVELQTGEIGDDFAYYFAVSEQTPSIVSLGVLVDTDNSVMAAGGLIIQMMPDAQEEDIVKTEQLLQTLKPMSTLLHEGQTIQQIVQGLYEDVEIAEESHTHFHCGCSRETMKRALLTIQPSEVEAMIDEDQGAEIICHFCNTSYEFDEQELRDLVAFAAKYGKK